MKRFLSLVILTCSITASADVISLFDWGVHVNGTVTKSITELDETISWTDDFWETGLGTVSIELDSSQDYDIAWFFDYEIDETINTFYNEYGVISGIPADARLTFEIDKAGFGTGNAGSRSNPDNYSYIGDIYDNFSGFGNRGFDGQVFYVGFTGNSLSDYENPISDDVSMALGWNFSLGENETARLEYTITDIAPTSGFYLAQYDRDSPEMGIFITAAANSC